MLNSIELREYQSRTVDMIKDCLRSGCKKVMVTLPTGAGKSILQGVISKMCIDRGNKILALMHRRGLVDQLCDRFSLCGVDAGKIMSQVDAELSKDVQVGTIQTYSRRIQLEEYDIFSEKNIKPWQHNADVILLDEAHRSLSKTFQDTLKSYKDKVVLGFTATPTLSSGVGMGNYYEKLIQPVQVQELIDCGALVPGVYYGLSAPDLTNIKMQNGDYEQKELGSRYNNKILIGDVVKNWTDIAFGKRTMVFAVNVEHSKALVHEFNKFGISAAHLDSHSSDDERNCVLSKFVSGEIMVLSNVGLYTEGTDIPEIECICLALSTKSIGRYLQMVGRGARPCSKILKKNFLILDHGNNVNRHGFYEDPIVWTLDGEKISYKKPTPKDIKEKAEKTKMKCGMCSAMFVGSQCPECHTKISEYGKKIEAIEAELKILNGPEKKEQNKDKAAILKKMKPAILTGMLKHEAKRLGNSDKWIRANYRNITSRWPKSLDVRQLPATEELKGYLKYMRIKWVKSKTKGAKQW
jgi:DNA repair protein RadD